MLDFLTGGTLKIDDTIFPGLNNLIAPAFAWTYAQTGDRKYATMTDALLAGNATHEPRSWFFASGKAFDQAFYRIFNIIHWRAK